MSLKYTYIVRSSVGDEPEKKKKKKALTKAVTRPKLKQVNVPSSKVCSFFPNMYSGTKKCKKKSAEM